MSNKKGYDKSYYEALLPYADTKAQRAVISALAEGKSQERIANEAGKASGYAYKALRRVKAKAAKRGWSPEHDSTKPTPQGYMLRGTSTLYDEAGQQKLQWVKTQVDIVEQWEALVDAVKGLFEGVPRKRPEPGFPGLDADTFVLYPEGDPHWGMRVWGPEADGINYDLSIALQQYMAATEMLARATPSSDTAVMLNVGDNFHSDTPENKTRKSGNHLNVDGRLAKVFRTVVDARRYRIDLLLEKHNKVVVREVYGNHDEILTMGFIEALRGYYHNEPRVVIEDSPNAFWYYQHGKVLIGATHGDKAKIQSMPLLMATDAPLAWGTSEHRHIYTGHQHHMERWETAGAVVEMLRTLAGRNEYEHSHGYRSKRDMIARVFHREHGEVLTHRVSPSMFNDITEADH